MQPRAADAIGNAQQRQGTDAKRRRQLQNRRSPARAAARGVRSPFPRFIAPSGRTEAEIKHKIASGSNRSVIPAVRSRADARTLVRRSVGPVRGEAGPIEVSRAASGRAS